MKLFHFMITHLCIHDVSIQLYISKQFLWFFPKSCDSYGKYLMNSHSRISFSRILIPVAAKEILFVSVWVTGCRGVLSTESKQDTGLRVVHHWSWQTLRHCFCSYQGYSSRYKKYDFERNIPSNYLTDLSNTPIAYLTPVTCVVLSRLGLHQEWEDCEGHNH